MEPEKLINIVFKIIIIATILLTSFIVIIIYFRYKRNEYLKEKEILASEYQKSLLLSQIEVQEATFSTLSKDLHDNIGQLLSTAKMLLGIAERNTENPPDTLITANKTVGKAIDELRSLSKSLSKEWLEQFNLIENLTTEVNRINSDDGITLHLSHPEKIPLKADEQIMLFRIIQEAIQNAVKHSFAKNIFINILLQDEKLTASVKDDGRGFDQNERPDGVGMLNMKHRVKLLGGTMECGSNNAGSIVTIYIPVKTEDK